MSIPLVGPAAVDPNGTGAGQVRGYGDNRRFRAPRFVDEGDRMTQLEHLVAVGTSDVRVHLERLNMHISAGSEERAYGAIVDLFIASGPTAHEVRSRALFWAGSLLTSVHRRALHRYVEQGLSAATPMPAATCSLLSLGVTGSLQLVGPASEAPNVLPEPEATAPEPDVSAPEPRSGDEPTSSTPVRALVIPSPARPPETAPATSEPASGRPSPRASMPTTAAASVPSDPFAPEKTIIGFVKRYTSLPTTPTHAWYVSAPFGQCAIWGNSVWFQVDDETHLTDELTTADLEVKRIDALALDSTQAQSARIVLWNLGAYISGGRLPADVPTDVPMILRNWPDLTRVARVREDTKLAATLSRTPTTVGDLPDRPNVRAFLSAAWVSGALVPAERHATTIRSGSPTHQPVSSSTLRGLVSRLRRKAE